MECQHKSVVGDNYGESCRDCGTQIRGFGYGGFFGRNLTGNETCIHLWSPMGEGGEEVCIYCETFKSEFEKFGKEKSDSWDINDDVIYEKRLKGE